MRSGLLLDKNHVYFFVHSPESVICLIFIGFVVYRVRIRRGGRKRPVAKGQVYGKPKSCGVNQLKNQRSLQAVAEVHLLTLLSRLLNI